MRPLAVFAAGVLTFVSSLVVTFKVRSFALRTGLMDRPSSRSSHTVPTPRGGGLSIVLVFLSALACLCSYGLVSLQKAAVLTTAGAAVALIGFLDDRRPISPVIRLVVHVAAATVIVMSIGRLQLIAMPRAESFSAWVNGAFCVLAIAWATNLYNFMDGIDGLAGAETLFISVAGASINAYSGGEPGLTVALLLLGCATLGFLVLNWPPASIFMGDVGSGFLGFMLASIALAVCRSSPVPIEIWPLLAGVFAVDSTVTLIRRLIRRDQWFAAHRMHAYQHLARRWGKHLPVTVLVMAINISWLLPWACVATLHPDYSPLYLALAVFPLAFLIYMVGAGTP